MEKMDHIKALAAAGASLIPGVGGPLGTLLQEYLPSTWQVRQEESIRRLESDFERLKSKLADQKLRSEAFHVSLIRVIRLMIMELNEEKRTAFRAIILNEALIPTVSTEFQFFVGITEFLSGDHIRMLRILSNPLGFVEANPEILKSIQDLNTGGMVHLLKPAFPGFERGHLDAIADDLHQKSLSKMSREGLGSMSSRAGLLTQKTTEIGERYLRFISLPNECIE